jgi:drug/metabolite transporter (DMT)-like permease
MTNGLLYGVTVLLWGSTWLAIKYQLGVVAPEVSVVYRFAIAAALIFAWAIYRGLPLRFGPRAHLRMAGLGLFIFSTNYVLFYTATASLTTGLVAVIFSTAIIMNIVNGAIFLGRRVDRRVAVGAACGLAGMLLVFWPELTAFSFDNAASLAIALSLAGTLLFSLGNMVSAGAQKAGLPLIPSTAYAMAYGTLLLTLFVLLRGIPFAFDPAPTYVGALLYLAVFGSVAGFLCYLGLLGRIGADRAAYATVLFPIVALALSTLFEDFHWTLGALAGVALILGGNALVLAKPAPPRPRGGALKERI